MESLTTKEFLDKLKNNNLPSGFVLKGFVKTSDKESELQFAYKQDSGHWISLPSSMVGSVTVLKSFPNKYEPSAFVKLELDNPADPSAKVLYELLVASLQAGSHHCMYGGKSDPAHNQWSNPGFAGGHTGSHCLCCCHNCTCGCRNKNHSEHTCHRGWM